jgi:hypothetical protein
LRISWSISKATSRLKRSSTPCIGRGRSTGRVVSKSYGCREAISPSPPPRPSNSRPERTPRTASRRFLGSAGWLGYGKTVSGAYEGVRLVDIREL